MPEHRQNSLLLDEIHEVLDQCIDDPIGERVFLVKKNTDEDTIGTCESMQAFRKAKEKEEEMDCGSPEYSI